MKVKDLIERLQDCDPEAVVKVYEHDSSAGVGGFYSLSRVDVDGEYVSKESSQPVVYLT